MKKMGLKHVLTDFVSRSKNGGRKLDFPLDLDVIKNKHVLTLVKLACLKNE
jgi:hypothetical protein